jgi:ATP/maltotriose-dependent transcriptional regulator MalT
MSNETAAGWAAIARGRWQEALAHFAGRDDDPRALEGIGIANWWLDDADATMAARERAYRLFRAAGDPRGAARVASALAWDAILFDGRIAVGRGWLARAARLLADQPLGVEQGWLAVREAEVALASSDPAAAREAAGRAVDVGVELEREDVQVAARSVEGLALVQEGDVDGGMHRLDEAAVAATAGDVGDLEWIGKVCCNMIAACERVGDVDRATQWCAEVKEFAQRLELTTLFNTCRTLYAGVLLHQGTWDEAERELTAALDVLGRGRRSTASDAVARLGELRRRQGRLDEARALFGQAESSFIGRLGQVQLALDEGDAGDALALVERLARQSGPYPRLARIDVLASLARAALAAARPDLAREAVAELRSLAELVGTDLARAGHAAAAGALAAAEDDLELARRFLEDAVDLYGNAVAPYERARARLLLAAVLRRLDARERAMAEASLAHAAFRELDARRDARDAAAFVEILSPVRQPGPLTRRELDVMALIVAGRTNREIATELVVSRHTVHRHVANILRKLGEPSRAAAAARATRDGLV